MAESIGRRHLLLGEATRSDRADPAALLAEPRRKAQRVPFRRGRQVHFALWLKHCAGGRVEEASIFTPDTVMSAPPSAHRDGPRGRPSHVMLLGCSTGYCMRRACRA